MKYSIIAQDDLQNAAETIRSGGIVAFPTETYYGLAVDPFNEVALRKLFKVKERPELKPVLLLVADFCQLDTIVKSIPDLAQKLMNKFWPGPLTLVLPAVKELSSYITGGTDTVGVRLSPHPEAQKFLNACGIPLTATSANRSGHLPAISADEVRAIFGEQVDFILDGGITPGKKGSTLVGFDREDVLCIREGCIDFQAISDFLKGLK